MATCSTGVGLLACFSSPKTSLQSDISGIGFQTLPTEAPAPTNPMTTSTTTAQVKTTTTATTTTKQNVFNVHSQFGRDLVENYVMSAGNPPYPEQAENDLIFGIMTSVGYFFITLVLMVGVLMGDSQNFTVSSLS